MLYTHLVSGFRRDVMRTRFFTQVALIFYVFVCTSAVAESGKGKKLVDLEMATIVGRAIKRNVYLSLSEKFEHRHPGYTLNIQGYDDATFRASISRLIKKDRIHLGYTPSGSRLCSLVAEGLVRELPLGDHAGRFDKRMMRGVTCHDQVYGIPLFHYFWGFFYNKSTFSELNLDEPATWQAFLNVLRVLADNNRVPILLGAKNHWPVMSWFSYLNLRLHGIEFHQGVASGQIPVQDQRYAETLEHLSQVVQSGGFMEGFEHQTWNESLALLYRGHAGMILSGSFLINQLPPDVSSEIGFFPFPVINPDVPRYEESPLDAIFVSSNITEDQAVNSLIAFFTDPDTQAWFAAEMGYLPASPNAVVMENSLFTEGHTETEQARALTQYFDRDALPVLAEDVPPILTQFLLDTNVAIALTRMEKARLRALGN